MGIAEGFSRRRGGARAGGPGAGGGAPKIDRTAHAVQTGEKPGKSALHRLTLRRRAGYLPCRHHGFVNNFTNQSGAMSGAYLPLLLLFGVSIVNALGMVVTSHILNPRRDTPQKLMPYESGMIPLGTTRQRFSVKFYMVAISFIVFDLETIFLIPWAVQMRELGWSAFVAMTLFVIVLAVGLLYEWKKGGLEWD
jgi:NADH-quinone oxidoreductase subunit A